MHNCIFARAKDGKPSFAHFFKFETNKIPKKLTQLIVMYHAVTTIPKFCNRTKHKIHQIATKTAHKIVLMNLSINLCNLFQNSKDFRGFKTIFSPIISILQLIIEQNVVFRLKNRLFSTIGDDIHEIPIYGWQMRL